MSNLFDAFSKGLGIADAYRKNRMLKEEARVYPQLMNSKRDMAAAEAGLKGNELQFAPMMSQEALNEARTKNQYLGTGLAADIDYKRAQTGSVNTNTKLAPLNILLKDKQTNNSASRFGSAYQTKQLLQAMSPAAREVWIANNQDAYNNMLQVTANSNGAPSATNSKVEDVLRQLYPNLNIPDSKASAPGPQPSAPGQQPSGTQFNAPSDELNNKTRLANEISANNSLTTTKTRNQLEGAIQTESIMNDPALQARVKNAAAYAGIAGKGRAAIDALSQQNPAAYEDYLALANDDMPLILNRIKMLDGMGATDSQRGELHGLYKKTMDSVTSNPKQFIQQFNMLGQSLERVAKSVQKSATPVEDVNRLEGFNDIGANKKTLPGKGPRYTMADIEEASKQYGMPIPQVKALLAKKDGVSIHDIDYMIGRPN